MFAFSRRISSPIPRRLVPGLCVTAACIACGTASADAAVVSTGACDASTLTQPFTKWGDANWYKPAPGGDFESATTSWTLTGGARLTSGSEPFGVSGHVGSRSLTLPAGATAVSPATCVNAGYPALRFFARNNGVASTVLVQLSYLDPVLGLVKIPVGTVGLSGSWEPTLRMLTGSLVAGALAGGTANLSVRFTALTGTSQIDDVYVDPRMK